jgi:hypothetical protein
MSAQQKAEEVPLRQAAKARDARVCANCETVESDRAARFCRRCGKPFA